MSFAKSIFWVLLLCFSLFVCSLPINISEYSNEFDINSLTVLEKRKTQNLLPFLEALSPRPDVGFPNTLRTWESQYFRPLLAISKFWDHNITILIFWSISVTLTSLSGVWTPTCTKLRYNLTAMVAMWARTSHSFLSVQDWVSSLV